MLIDFIPLFIKMPCFYMQSDKNTPQMNDFIHIKMNGFTHIK